jgi:hypothetical protein
MTVCCKPAYGYYRSQAELSHAGHKIAPQDGNLGNQKLRPQSASRREAQCDADRVAAIGYRVGGCGLCLSRREFWKHGGNDFRDEIFEDPDRAGQEPVSNVHQGEFDTMSLSNTMRLLSRSFGSACGASWNRSLRAKARVIRANRDFAYPLPRWRI